MGQCHYVGGNCQGEFCTHPPGTTDNDYDGYDSSVDCNDTDASINPGKSENCSNGHDDNCDGQSDCDDAGCAITCNPPSQPCPGNDCNAGGNAFDLDYCTYPGTGCPSGYNNTGSCCQPQSVSPILVDVDGSGFQLTSGEHGVLFDFFKVRKLKIAWTAIGSTNAWLVMDRDGNGTIDNGQELFGNLTPQPFSANPQGFIALSVYDEPAHGGNGDGIIIKRDSVFDMLSLWQDANHNGISESTELHSVESLGLTKISLDYRESKRRDRYGNEFKYRAIVRDKRDAQFGRWAWDVFLVKAP